MVRLGKVGFLKSDFSFIYNIYCSITDDWSKYYKMPWEAYADYLGGVKR